MLVKGNRWRIALAGTLATAAAMVGAEPAAAIVGGAPDNGAHPYAGAVDGRPLGGANPFASGVLISPTVFVTAAHFTVHLDRAGITRVRVTFEGDARTATTWYTGTVHTNPAYQPSAGYVSATNDPGDVAVIVFDTPIPGIAPASLPTAGLLDNLRPSPSDLDVLGYGCQAYLPNPDGSPTSIPDFSTSGLRKLVEGSFVSAGAGLLKYLVEGQASLCRGDSGGPALLGGTNIVVGTTSVGAGYGQMQWDERLDTAASRAFLGQYVTLP